MSRNGGAAYPNVAYEHDGDEPTVSIIPINSATEPNANTVRHRANNSNRIQPASGAHADHPAISEAFDSLDYETVENQVVREVRAWCIFHLFCNNRVAVTCIKLEVKRPGFKGIQWRKAFNRWLVCFFTGLVTALIGCAINIVIDIVVEKKFQLIQHYFNTCSDGSCWYQAMLIWVGFNVAMVACASGLVVFIAGPVAAGSGIPQIKCFLNGIKIPSVVSLKTLVAKAIGVLFSVSGGLTVGKEGPMIHSGACVAATLSQARTGEGKWSFGLRIFDYYRTDPELRDFVSCGAAAGVAVAFGAPIGGVLFSLEEGASFYNQALTWRMFFTSMTCGFFLNLIMSFYYSKPGDIAFSGLVNFGVFNSSVADYDFWMFIIALLIAIIGGVLGGLFNYGNQRLTLFRIRHLSSKMGKFGEAIIVAAVSAASAFCLIILVRDCEPLKAPEVHMASSYPVQIRCGEGDYSAIAALFMTSPEKAVVKLFHENHHIFDCTTLALFAILQYILAMWTYGVSVASGLFIPSLLVGAAWGRLLAMGLGTLFPQAQILQHVGLYALAGAAAQLGGNVRMTISLAVILIEATHDISFGLPLMIILMVAKWVGDIFGEGLYDIHIEINEIPLLHPDPPFFSPAVDATQVMMKPVCVLRQTEKVSRIYYLLQTKRHNGFPVVDLSHTGTGHMQTCGRLLGFVTRKQMLILLAEKAFAAEGGGTITRSQLDSKDFRKPPPKVADLELSDTEMNSYVDLESFMNKAPYTVSEHATLTKLYQLFRGLGLRHVTVVNGANEVLGIVTRQDLARFKAEFRIGRLQQHTRRVVSYSQRL